MGTFRHNIEVGDPEGEQYVRLDALVDTGASYTVLPASILRRLGVKVHDRLPFVLADGRKTEKEIGQTWIRVDQKAVITIVVFGSEDTETLLGAYALEGLRLGVDPLNKRLVPLVGYLM